MKSIGIFYRFAIALIGGMTLSQSASAVCFVNHAATGANNGSSWTDAYTNPQFALLNAACSEIWVAKGAYKPTLGMDRTISFVIPAGTTMYGGFFGDETTRDSRVPAVNVTVLSGDIDNNDANVTTTQVDATPADIHGTNSEHVVYLDGVNGLPVLGSTVLDGFTITGGNATGPTGSGGGLYCDGAGNEDASAGHECSPTLRNLIFAGNLAQGNGGAVFNDAEGRGNSSPTLIDVTFTGNAANNAGGGMANFAEGRGVSNPKLTNVMFIQNTARIGGGMSSRASVGGDAQSPQGGVSNPSLSSVVFVGNSATDSGGGMFNEAAVGGSVNPTAQIVTFSDNTTSGTVAPGGAVFNTCQGDGAGYGKCVVSLTNSTFSGNQAQQFGGAMYSESSNAASAEILLLNVTFADNSGSTGGALYNDQEDAALGLKATNVILWNDVARGTGGQPEIDLARGGGEISASVIGQGCPIFPTLTCTDVSDIDPRLGPLSENGGFTRTRVPGFGSSAIDTGLDSACPTTDQRGVSRPLGAHCEIGAVEVVPLPPPTAQSLEVTTQRDTPITVTLRGTDGNPGGPFSFTYSAGVPKFGTVNISGDKANFTPLHGFIGDDIFNYTVTDVNGTSDQATVIIHVLAVPPVAQPLSLFVPHNTTGTVTLMATDANAGGPFAYTFAITQTTQHGTATLSGSTVTYVPTTDYTGPDSLLYTATDENGLSQPALVSIQVGAIPPVAQPRSITVPRNTPGVITFGATDSNSNGPFTYTFATASSPSHGMLSSVSGSNITYTPAHNYSGPDSFTYTATDVNGTSIPATVKITVLPAGGGTVPVNIAALPTLNVWNIMLLAGLLVACASLWGASQLKP